MLLENLCLALSLPFLFSSLKERNVTGENKCVYFSDTPSVEHYYLSAMVLVCYWASREEIGGIKQNDSLI